MAIIKKRVADLQPGDVVVPNVTMPPHQVDRHTVARIVPSSTPGYYQVTMRTGGPDGMPWQVDRPVHAEFDVEVPNGQPMMPPPIQPDEYKRPAAAPVLTTAQQHADAMADMLRQAVLWLTPGNGPIPVPELGDWCARCRKLLVEIEPQPPTLDEALAVVARLVADGAGGAPLNDAERLLNQARRAGMLK